MAITRRPALCAPRRRSGAACGPPPGPTPSPPPSRSLTPTVSGLPRPPSSRPPRPKPPPPRAAAALACAPPRRRVTGWRPRQSSKRRAVSSSRRPTYPPTPTSTPRHPHPLPHPYTPTPLRARARTRTHTQASGASVRLDELQARLQEAAALALQVGQVISVCPLQARQGRIALDVRSYGLTCTWCKKPGVWGPDQEHSLIGCMDCAEAVHVSCLGYAEPGWRCFECASSGFLNT